MCFQVRSPLDPLLDQLASCCIDDLDLSKRLQSLFHVTIPPLHSLFPQKKFLIPSLFLLLRNFYSENNPNLFIVQIVVCVGG